MPSPRDALLVSILFYGGLRVGEALALSWDSVRLDEGYLVVEQSFVKGVLKGTKTGLIRRVELCTPLRLDLEAAAPESPAAAGAFVCPSRQGGGKPLDRHNWHAHVWKPAIERAGVAASPGDGRHTFASLHLNAGEPLIASNQLGHRMTTTTELYSHLMPRDRTGRVVPVDAAILAARAEVAGSYVRKVYALSDYRRGGVAR